MSQIVEPLHDVGQTGQVRKSKQSEDESNQFEFKEWYGFKMVKHCAEIKSINLALSDLLTL